MKLKEKDLFLPALIGGAAAGLASTIPFLHCLCCLWVVAGGVLATYLVFDRTSDKSILKISDSLTVGALSGLFGAIINSILKIPLTDYYLSWNRRFLESMARFMDELPAGWDSLMQMRYEGFNPFLFLFGLIINGAVFVFLGAIGGLIGYSLFKTNPGVKNEKTMAQNQSDSQPGL
jgi:hypothetical protein